MEVSASDVPLVRLQAALTHSSLADWERLTRRAGAAMHMQQWRMAWGYQREAVAMALRISVHPPVGREEDCVAALVVSHLNLAESCAQAAAPSDAARLLCDAHRILLAWMADGAGPPALQQAAWRHSRETHAAMLRHVAEYGPHSLITEQLQASSRSAGDRSH